MQTCEVLDFNKEW